MGGIHVTLSEIIAGLFSFSFMSWLIEHEIEPQVDEYLEAVIKLKEIYFKPNSVIIPHLKTKPLLLV